MVFFAMAPWPAPPSGGHEPMTLPIRSVAIASAALGAVALVLLGWQLRARQEAGGPLAERPGSSASGIVTGAAPAAAGLPAASPPAASSPAPASHAAGPPAIRHRVAPRPAAAPPILPTEVNAAVGKALGPRALARFFYLEPLARRFVASVDALGRQQPPTELWLLRPAPGELRLAGSTGKVEPDGRWLAAANSRRYTDFVSWVESSDSARLLALYARLYPLLQQSYVELGHPQGYFNDRLIEVIDQLLATPVPHAPLRLQPAASPAATAPGRPSRPRYEFSDPALESLSTGQKLLLRVGPLQAERLKAKLRVLRRGLLKLERA